MATIIISLVLLVMVAQESSSGWFARFMVLGIEAQEQASSLAEGCADQALAALIINSSYPGAVTTTIPIDSDNDGTCYVSPIQLNTPVAGQATIKTQAVVRGSFANFNVVENLNGVHIGGAAQPQYGTPTAQALPLTITLGSWQEVP
jgi:hypothetical protein